MRTHFLAASAVVMAALLAAASIAQSQQATASPKEKATASHYLITTTHTPAECLRDLDAMAAKGSDVLAQFEWGCTAGDHTGYAIVDAESEAAARNTLPELLRAKAKVVKLSKFTPEQIRTFHQKG